MLRGKLAVDRGDAEVVQVQLKHPVAGMAMVDAAAQIRCVSPGRERGSTADIREQFEDVGTVSIHLGFIIPQVQAVVCHGRYFRIDSASS